MKFNRIVVVMASSMLAFGAFAEPATQTTVQEQKTVVSTQTSDATPAAPAVTPAPTPAPVAAAVPAPAAPAPAPAVDSTDKKIDEIKQKRVDAEQKNDSKVVEKLEKTRLDEEKDLSKKIDSTNLKDDKKADASQVKIEKVEVIQPAAPVATPVAEEKKEEKQEPKKHEWYAGLGTGNVIYNANALQKASIGAMVGKMLDDHLAVEGSLVYSSFSLNNYWGGINGGLGNGVFGSMDQYDVGAAVKYYVLNGDRFRPYVGAAADYLYRTYYDRYIGAYVWNNYDNYTTGQNTNSLNASLLAGVDVKITDQISIGGEVKYSLPVYVQDNGLITQSYLMAYATPLEQTSFTSWLLTLKYFF
jgi:outer membrane protein W